MKKTTQTSSVRLAVSTALALSADVLHERNGPLRRRGDSQESALQEVVVTGSRIARQDYVAQSPIVTAPVESVQNSGVPTMDAYLLQLPQFQPGAGGFTNVSSGGLGVGQATLNLRGLGSVRTLTLLDGRRLQPGECAVHHRRQHDTVLRDLRRRSRDRWSFGHLRVGCGGGCRELQAPQNLFGRGGLRATRAKRARGCDHASGLRDCRHRVSRAARDR